MQENPSSDRTSLEKPNSDSGLLPSSSRTRPANQSASSSFSQSPKVHFGRTVGGGLLGSGHYEMTNDVGKNAVQDTEEAKKNKSKPSFKVVVLREVLGINQAGGLSWPGTGSPGGVTSTKKGILKVRGEEALPRGVADSEKQSLCFVNQAYVGDDDTRITDDVICSSRPSSIRPPTSSVATTDRSAFPYARRRSSDNGFSGVVELLLQRSNLDLSCKRDSHPFGRDSSVEAVLEGDNRAPKRQTMSSAYTNLVVWFALLSFLVGSVLGLIFLSEMYNAKHREDNLLRATLNETQNVT